MLSGNTAYRSKWFRLGTPLIDTVLLILGLALAITAGELLYTSPWFMEKMGLLIAYIMLGMMSLGRLKSYHSRALSYILALASAGGMFHAALTKQSIVQLIMNSLV
jgi:uncharacterized membrane protein SirB2